MVQDVPGPRSKGQVGQGPSLSRVWEGSTKDGTGCRGPWNFSIQKGTVNYAHFRRSYPGSYGVCRAYSNPMGPE